LKNKIFVIGLVSILLFMNLGSVSGKIEIKAGEKSSTSQELPDFEVIEIKNIKFDREEMGGPHAGILRILYTVIIKNNGATFDKGAISYGYFIDGVKRTVSFLYEGVWESGETKSFEYCQTWPDIFYEHALSFVVDYDGGEIEEYSTGENHGDYEESDETNNDLSIVTKFKRPRSSNFANPFLALILEELAISFPILQQLLNL